MGAALSIPKLRRGTLPEGIWRPDISKKLWACLIGTSRGKGRVSLHDTEQGAIAEREKCLKGMAKSRKPDKEVAAYSDRVRHMKQERDFCGKIVGAWQTERKLPALVAQDGARGDVLIGMEANSGEFFQIQVKTTATTKAGTDNTRHFNDVLGYKNMAVIAADLRMDRWWIYDGWELDARGIKDLDVTPGGENEQDCVCKGQGMESLVNNLAEQAGKFTELDHKEWTKRTEWAGRNDIKGKETRTEMAGILAAAWNWPEASLSWPGQQASKVDVILHGDGKDHRLQFKTAKRSRDGLYSCHMGAREGAGTKEAYSDEDFDYLVAVGRRDSTSISIWIIPMHVLRQQRVVRSKGVTGVTDLILHERASTEGKDGALKNTWTSQFRKGPFKNNTFKHFYSLAQSKSNFKGRIPGNCITKEERDTLMEALKGTPSFQGLFFVGNQPGDPVSVPAAQDPVQEDSNQSSPVPVSAAQGTVEEDRTQSSPVPVPAAAAAAQDPVEEDNTSADEEEAPAQAPTQAPTRWSKRPRQQAGDWWVA